MTMSKPLRKWTSEYPDCPDLTGDDAPYDIQRYLDTDDPLETQEGRELFHAAILSRFCSQVCNGEALDRWIVEFLAEQFHFVLRGAAWDERFKLPGRDIPKSWDDMHPRDKRDMMLHCRVADARQGGEDVTKAMRIVADECHVSFETVRAAYYVWRDRMAEWRSRPSDDDVSKNSENI